MNELIAADEVIGTEVYTADGRKLGRVDNIMIDRVSGKSLYAMMSSGGFLGIGEAHYPLPWSRLHYDDALQGYVVDLSEDEVKRTRTDRHGHAAPSPEREPIDRPNHQIMD